MPEIIRISSIHIPELAIYSQPSETQLLHYFEPEEGIFIAESPKVIERALNAGYEPISLLMEEKHLTGEGTPLLSRCGDVPVYTADASVLTGITGFALTRGALCAMRRKPMLSPEIICRNARRIAVLEDVVNPTNVGAIFRNAAALHMDAVLLTPASSDPLYRRSARVSMGTVFQIPWTYLDKTSGIGQLKEMGFRTAAMALREDSVNVDAPQLIEAERLAVVLGTEGDGLASVTIAACDDTVCIPMSHEVDSLNVAAASAIAFFMLGNRSY